MEKRVFKIRPYARLLTMLGEQLIRNEQIALAELIKNSYDADADWVKVSFENFEQDEEHNINLTQASKIVIEDNGCGMTLPIIEKSWMNPATPNKKAINGDETIITPRGRIMQGEKGIGRFAILKLGRNIAITTRPINSIVEYVIKYDLSKYDDEFLTENGKEKELFIDNIDIDVIEQDPQVFVNRTVVVDGTPFKKNTSGTRIEITNLKGFWSTDKIEEVNKESQKLESIFDKIFNKNTTNSFQIGFELNTEKIYLSNKIEQLSNLLAHSAVLRITDGLYDEDKQTFSYKINDIPYEISLQDSRIVGLSIFRKRFYEAPNLFNNNIIRKSECGSFRFNFFVFDFVADKESSYYLDKQDKKLIKEHRIYLYRDKIRVAPYGDPDNDWLEIDKWRGVGRAGDYLSNDQVVGFVDITKKSNPNLKDKTNREGLIETGNATNDFIILIHSFLLFIRQHAYRQYQENAKRKKEQQVNKLKVVEDGLTALQPYIADNNIALGVYNKLIKSYNIERDFYQKRIEITEDLAGVGLSVETASHDIMMMMSRGFDLLDSVIQDIKGSVLNQQDVVKELFLAKEAFSFVNDRMRDIQLLFKSSKQRRRDVKIVDLLAKVEKIYRRTLERNNIKLNINKCGAPIIAKCTDAVILQVLINLFDNAVYWLSTINIVDKQILITLNGDNQQLIFSDNGPGVHPDDEPYIFEAFYSGKEEGRGLGLYIAKQLLERLEYNITLSNRNILPGANFIINF